MSHAHLRRRLPLLLAGSLAGLSLAAAPAFAGSDGDQPPPVVQPPAPAPPAPLPLPQTPQSGVQGESESQPVTDEKPAVERSKRTTSPNRQTSLSPTRQTTTVRTRPVVTRTITRGTTATQTFPVGGVGAGGGGTAAAPSSPAETLGLGGASLALLLAAGGLAVARRRSGATR